MTTASELILSSLHSRPMTAQDLIGLLVQKGYEQDVAGAITDAWLSIFLKRGAIDAVMCDSALAFRAVADYEQEAEPKPEVKWSANEQWKNAIAEHGRKHG